MAAGWQPLQGKVAALTCSVVPCTATTLDIFDKLRNASEPIIRDGTWNIMKCFDDELEGYPIQDMLREFLLRGHDSVNAGTLSNNDLTEFLWRLFTHLALGGSMNQFEDDLAEYRTAVRTLYKDLVSCAPGLGTTSSCSFVK